MLHRDWFQLLLWPRCSAAAAAILALLSAGMGLGLAGPGLALPLSPGDRLKLSIPDGEEFSGLYEVNQDGKLEIPYLPPLNAAGLEPSALQQSITHALLSGGYFQPSFLRVSVNVIQWAPAQVFVQGATFLPGRVLINELSDAELTQPPVQISGNNPTNRYLSVALRQAGGLRPTADIKTIQLIRAGKPKTLDLSGIFNGEPFEDVPLIAGDQVIVPDTGVVNNLIVRPSQVTPVGVKIFLSNLTVPATGNSISGISRDATSFSYGSRFSQAVVAANCVGGTRGTNAGRRAILVTTNELTGKTSVLERGIHELMQASTDDRNNPYLMANDSVACFDSTVTSIRDVMRTLSDVILPGTLIRAFF